MQVKQLIELLSQYDEHLEVVLDLGEQPGEVVKGITFVSGSEVIINAKGERIVPSETEAMGLTFESGNLEFDDVVFLQVK